jgi:hypothetical protein
MGCGSPNPSKRSALSGGIDGELGPARRSTHCLLSDQDYDFWSVALSRSAAPLRDSPYDARSSTPSVQLTLRSRPTTTQDPPRILLATAMTGERCREVAQRASDKTASQSSQRRP